MTMRATLALIACICASPALAEVVIEPGAHFMIARDYDYETDSYTNGPPKGEATACFRITRVDLEAREIAVELISGTYDPWWSQEILKPGFVDTYVPAIGYMENHPQADWTTLLRNMWKTVPGCPAEVS